MWYMHPTEKWIDNVVQTINEKQLRPEDSILMIAFFSSLDDEFVEYFQKNKDRISSFSGENFHIFTPLIYEDKVIPDSDWRSLRKEFNLMGVPVGIDPTFVFFKIDNFQDVIYKANFFAGFSCKSFSDFPNKLKNAIEVGIEIKKEHILQQKLSEIFATQNIINPALIKEELKNTIENKLPQAKIFISHSSVDKPFVKEIMKELSTNNSLKFWIDEKEIMVGDNIQESISRNLRDSDFILLIISRNSTNSDWVNFEISQFMGFSNNKKIIPILKDKKGNFSIPIDNLLKQIKYLDFSDKNNWNKNIEELKSVLK